jgi:hypothetical protein
LNLERFHAGRRLELERLSLINGSAAQLQAPPILPGTKEEIAEIKLNA